MARSKIISSSDAQKKICKIGIVSEKVMPYRCALYRALAKREELDIKVLFLDKWGFEERFDPTMGQKYSWGEDVLRGFKYEFLDNSTPVNVTYTGADRTNRETHLGKIGTALFYMRTFFSTINYELPKKIYYSSFDMIIIENYASLSNILAILAARIAGKKIVMRNEGVLKPNSPMQLRVFKKVFLSVIFKFFWAFMYSSSRHKEYYIHYGASKKQMIYVPSAVDKSFKSTMSDIDRNLTRKEMGFGKEDLIFLGVGRLVPRKNWEEAIASFLNLCFVKTDIHFILIGDGPNRNHLCKILSAHPNGKFVQLHGFKSQKQLIKYYEISDVIVQSSLYDPSPKTLNEAIGFGLPMIVSNQVGTAGDVCLDGENGFVYQSGNSKQLMAKMFEIVDSKNVRERFRYNSNRLQPFWSLDVCSDNIVRAATAIVQKNT